MTNKHTSTPWFKVWNGCYWEIQEIDKVHAPTELSVSCFKSSMNAEANVDRIVKCVNLHDELVEALTNCVHHLYPLLHNVEKSDTLDMRIRQAEKALKKAKGESHD